MIVNYINCVEFQNSIENFNEFANLKIFDNSSFEKTRGSIITVGEIIDRNFKIGKIFFLNMQSPEYFEWQIKSIDEDNASNFIENIHLLLKEHFSIEEISDEDEVYIDTISSQILDFNGEAYALNEKNHFMESLSLQNNSKIRKLILKNDSKNLLYFVTRYVLISEANIEIGENFDFKKINDLFDDNVSEFSDSLDRVILSFK